jgi:histidine ammonia-lyase
MSSTRPDASVQIDTLHADLDERLATLRDDPAPVDRSRERVEEAMEDGKAYYGINTGFGALAQKKVPREELETLQRNLVFSHAVGVATSSPRPSAASSCTLRFTRWASATRASPGRRSTACCRLPSAT